MGQEQSRKVFVSNAIGEERLPSFNEGGRQIRYGAAHYSWKVIRSLYVHGLEKVSGLEVVDIVRPEIYQAPVARQLLGLDGDDLHIAIKPIEHIRPMYGVKNIFICGWEFPQLSNSSHGEGPFLNQVRILEHANQVWCWSNFTRDNLRKYGIDCAVTLPPPVNFAEDLDRSTILDLPSMLLDSINFLDVATVQPLRKVLEKFEGCRTFVSVLNPFDRRKQFQTMLKGFMAALERNPDLLLLVKLVIDNDRTTLVNIQEIINTLYGLSARCDRVIFVGETLSDVQVASFIQLGDYYLCTSSTEGLNLPLIEAMGLGVVPVSARNSAMLDYLDEGNSIAMDCEERETGEHYHALSEFLVTTHFPPSVTAVCEAVSVAADLPEDTYQKYSRQAKREVYKRYGIDTFVDQFARFKEWLR